jgi:hypothetical protein
MKNTGGSQHPLWRSQFRPATTPRRSRGASHCAGGNGGEIHGEEEGGGGRGGGGEEWPRHLVEREVAGVVPRERGDAADGQLGGVVEVVDDDGAEAREEELQHGVATDVARPARDQHGPPSTRAGQRLLHRHGSLARAASLPQPQAATYLPPRLPAPASASSTRARAKGGGGGEEALFPAGARIWPGPGGSRRGTWGVEAKTMEWREGWRRVRGRPSLCAAGVALRAAGAAPRRAPRSSVSGRKTGCRWCRAAWWPGTTRGSRSASLEMECPLRARTGSFALGWSSEPHSAVCTYNGMGAKLEDKRNVWCHYYMYRDWCDFPASHGVDLILI